MTTRPALVRLHMATPIPAISRTPTPPATTPREPESEVLRLTAGTAAAGGAETLPASGCTLGSVLELLCWKTNATQPPSGTASADAATAEYFQLPDVPSDQNRPQ